MHLFNSNDATEYTYHTIESAYVTNAGVLRGGQGGGGKACEISPKTMQVS